MYLGSSTPLESNATYTSGTMLSERNDNLAGVVFADQSGSLIIEQGVDGTNWDKKTVVAISAASGPGEGTTFSEPLLLPYFRVRYANGGTDQGTFRIAARFISAGVDT